MTSLTTLLNILKIFNPETSISSQSLPYQEKKFRVFHKEKTFSRTYIQRRKPSQDIRRPQDRSKSF